MQSYFQHRQISKQLEKQFVVKHDKPDDVWTRERRYSYSGGEIQSNEREESGWAREPASQEHGQRTFVSGPTLQPRHSTRTHLEHDGDVERADYADPEIRGDPHTINSQETLGGTPDMMVTGVERRRPENEPYDVPDGVADGTTKDGPVHPDKIIVVTFEGEYDQLDPHNWSFLYRVSYTVLLSLTAATMLWGSTIDAIAFNPASTKIYGQYNFALETVPSALYLIGLGIGGFLMAPISEVVGRNPVYIPCLVLFMLFELVGLARTVPQRIVLKGFAGLFGSGPLVCTAASLVDMWSRIERVYAFPMYAIISSMGPIVAVTPGSFVTMAHGETWRWVDWMTIILAGIMLFFIVLCMPETYGPVLLQWKAKKLRRLTKDPRYRAPPVFKRVSFGRRVAHAIYRPFLLLATEPIVMVFAVYLSVIFTILYTFIGGYSAIYEKIYKFSTGMTGLAFLGTLVGLLFAAPLVPVAMKLLRRDIHRSRAQGHENPGPEISLYMAMFGAPAIPISLFWMGWTARPSITFWSPIVSSVVLGYGTVCVFISSYQYVADVFEHHAASALAGLQMLRLVCAGVMAVVSEEMYKSLGVAWTLTVLGGIATVFLPVPYLLYRWGPAVRRWSRYAKGRAG